MSEGIIKNYEHCEKHKNIEFKELSCPLCLIKNYRNALHHILHNATRCYSSPRNEKMLINDLEMITKIADEALKTNNK